MKQGKRHYGEGEAADPYPKGLWPTAKQSFKDLFIWKQRTEIVEANGDVRYEWRAPPPIQNPFTLFAKLGARGWLFFIVGLICWMADAFDFHALSIQTVKLAAYYKKTNTDITTAITLTLLLRSVGAAVFGLLADRYGRKWPLVVNMIILGFLQIGTIYSGDFETFLGVRALFGLFMGGVYGSAIAMALENCPVDARGLMSGILQQGYSMGYVLAACANLGFGGETETWKKVFWVGAGLSFFAALVRIPFGESRQFIEAKKEGHKGVTPRAFWRETRRMLRKEWKMCVYCIILMTWFNYYSHTSQDSYTTFMRTQKALDNSAASRASILMKVGACVGGTIIGYISQFTGRRRAIIVASLMSCLMIPAWILPQGERSLSVTGFFMQFFVQGAWGVIPIHLNELSPPQFRSSFPGLSYQIGNMISSPSAQIVNAIAESHLVKDINGEPAPAYGPTMGIATAIIAMGIVVTTMFGPEKRGRHFELAKVAGEEDSESGSINEGVRAQDLEKGRAESPTSPAGSGDELNEKAKDEKIERV